MVPTYESAVLCGAAWLVSSPFEVVKAQGYGPPATITQDEQTEASLAVLRGIASRALHLYTTQDSGGMLACLRACKGRSVINGDCDFSQLGKEYRLPLECLRLRR